MTHTTLLRLKIFMWAFQHVLSGESDILKNRFVAMKAYRHSMLQCASNLVAGLAAVFIRRGGFVCIAFGICLTRNVSSAMRFRPCVGDGPPGRHVSQALEVLTLALLTRCLHMFKSMRAQEHITKLAASVADKIGELELQFCCIVGLVAARWPFFPTVKTFSPTCACGLATWSTTGWAMGAILLNTHPEKKRSSNSSLMSSSFNAGWCPEGQLTIKCHEEFERGASSSP
eukprot:6466393-Amphidinium_carterae.2